MTLLHNKEYYDRFSKRYDGPRDHGYHWMIDTLQAELMRPLAHGADVLEVGCGTGLLMDRIADVCNSLQGVDISSGMAARARKRGHRVMVGGADRLPFADNSFDLVYSFKVLAHIESIRQALAEMTRVLRPGGRFLGDFYNPRSLRGLIKKLKPPTAVAKTATDEHVFTRYDTPAAVLGYYPENLEHRRFYGVRVLTPFAGVLKLPGISSFWTQAENRAGRSCLWRFGGFLVTVAQKR
jgi:ubiquinone/menaquinone biosynthesis C-methylase UbiE